jgi:hypothetical protein
MGGWVVGEWVGRGGGGARLKRVLGGSPFPGFLSYPPLLAFSCAITLSFSSSLSTPLSIPPLPQLGFRHTEVCRGRLLHNGRAITLRGVNRHEFDCVAGKAVSESSMEADIAAMKRAGFNAVRCSHYPNATRW